MALVNDPKCNLLTENKLGQSPLHEAAKQVGISTLYSVTF